MSAVQPSDVPVEGSGGNEAHRGAVEALARVLSDSVLHPTDFESWGHMADELLADPGPLLEALATAGVLREERGPLKRRARGGWAPVYDGEHTVEGHRYTTEWRADD